MQYCNSWGNFGLCGRIARRSVGNTERLMDWIIDMRRIKGGKKKMRAEMHQQNREWESDETGRLQEWKWRDRERKQRSTNIY